MKRLPSIRQRLSHVLIVVSVAWSLAVSVVVWFTVHHEVDELLDGTLRESAEILFGLLAFDVARLPLQGGAGFAAAPHDEHLVWQIVGPDRSVLMRSHRAPGEALAALPLEGFVDVGQAWRVFGMRFDDQGRYLYVAQRGPEREAACLQAADTTAALALVVGLACALWLRLRVRRELVPIESLSGGVAQFDPLQAGASLPQTTRAELVPMREAIHDLGSRLARRIAAERAFSGHAAHALRTPLAGMVAQLAVAQRKSPAEAQPHLQRTRDAADRLQQVVTALLAMFRSGGEAVTRPVDLAGLVAHLPFEGLAIEIVGPSRIEADPDLLAAALMNLLDNASRHGAKRVVLSTHEAAGRTALLVRDDGTGVTSEERQRLQAALDEQSYEGRTGLGLMLADLVARAHGGSLRIVDRGPGFAVEIGLSR